MSWPIVTAAVAALLSSASAGAQDTAPAQPVAEKKICRGIVPTGSVLAKRFCLTKTEWATFNRLNDENADEALRKRVNIVPPTRE